MTDDPVIAKVTVIVETEHGVQTTVFHKAVEVDWNMTYSEPEVDWTATRFIAPPELVFVSLYLRPLKREDGVTHTMNVELKAE